MNLPDRVVWATMMAIIRLIVVRSGSIASDKRRLAFLLMRQDDLTDAIRGQQEVDNALVGQTRILHHTEHL